MFEFTSKDIKVGDEFTVDQGENWWRASKVEPRPREHVWIEAQHIGSSAVSSEVYEPTDIFIVR